MKLGRDSFILFWVRQCGGANEFKCFFLMIFRSHFCMCRLLIFSENKKLQVINHFIDKYNGSEKYLIFHLHFYVAKVSVEVLYYTLITNIASNKNVDPSISIIVLRFFPFCSSFSSLINS